MYFQVSTKSNRELELSDSSVLIRILGWVEVLIEPEKFNIHPNLVGAHLS